MACSTSPCRLATPGASDELVAPTAYQADPAYHCTAVLTTDTASAAATIAVPEMPSSGNLAFTGLDSLWMGVAGAALTAVGGGAMLLGRRRRSDRAAVRR